MPEKAFYEKTYLGELQADFDEGIWNAQVEEMTVYSKKEIVVRFFDGAEMKV